MAEEQPSLPINGPTNGLTCIPQRIHCATTNEATEKLTETERAMTEGFFETLAEVAVKVARRKMNRRDGAG